MERLLRLPMIAMRGEPNEGAGAEQCGVPFNVVGKARLRMHGPERKQERMSFAQAVSGSHDATVSIAVRRKRSKSLRPKMEGAQHRFVEDEGNGREHNDPREEKIGARMVFQ